MDNVDIPANPLVPDTVFESFDPLAFEPDAGAR